MAKRIYTSKDEQVKVFWNSDRCRQCHNCVESLPQVFKPEERPWIKIDAATPEQIKETVRNCPVQAISLDDNHKDE